MAKVLLVEDDNNLREIYQARLMAEGYDIVAAQNGEEALVIAKQNKPDLVISDVMMPRISGFEMLDILRNTQELRDTKVIMLTALGQADDQKRADGLGANRYLVKSQVTLEDIVNAAKDLLAEDGISAVPAPTPSDPLADAPTPMTSPAAAATVAATTAPVTAQSPSPVPTPPVAATVPLPEPVATAPQVAPAPVEPVTAASVPAVPTPVPAPEPAPAPTVAMPAPEVNIPTSAPTPAPVAAAPPVEPATTITNEAQTLADEEAALQAQIESYSQAPAEPAVAVDPTESAESNEEAITDAVEELNAPTEEEVLQPPSVVNATVAESVVPSTSPAPVAAAPVDPTPVVEISPTIPVATEPASEAATTTVGVQPVTEPTEPTQQVNIAGKKVIKPINDLSQQKPNLDALLAKEEASAAAAMPATPVIGGSASTPAQPSSDTPVPPATPGQSFDPNSVAL